MPCSSADTQMVLEMLHDKGYQQMETNNDMETETETETDLRWVKDYINEYQKNKTFAQQLP